MSKITTKYFQMCDICNKTFEIDEKLKGLCEIKVPMDFFPCDGGGRTTVVNSLSLCTDCLREMRDVLNTAYDMMEIEYGGVIVKRRANGERKEGAGND